MTGGRFVPPASAVLAAVALGGCAVCAYPLGRPLGETVPHLEGTYSVTFRDWEGRSTSGRLWLRQTSPTDRSRRGVIAVPPVAPLIRTPYYGAAEIDFTHVGIPRCVESCGSSPRSDDPVYPGVLVRARPVNGIEIRASIGGSNNRRDGQLTLGGHPGVLLEIEFAGPQGFSGQWGVASSAGLGYFWARRTGSAPTPR